MEAEMFVRGDFERAQPEAADSELYRIPTLSQLQSLFEAEKLAAAQPVQAASSENAVPQAQPVAADACETGRAPVFARPSVDLPSLEQLTRLKTEADVPEPETALPRQRTAVRADVRRRARTLRAPVSSDVRRRERNARPAAAPAPVRRKKAAVQAIRQSRKSPVPAASAAEDAAAFSGRTRPDFGTLPSLSQLQSMLANAEARSFNDPDAAVSDRFPAGTLHDSMGSKSLPTLDQLKTLRDAVARQTADKWDELLPANTAEAPFPTSAFAGKELADLPTASQLQAMLASEREYGDQMFQARVREIRQSAKTQRQPDLPQAEEASPRETAPLNERQPVRSREGVGETETPVENAAPLTAPEQPGEPAAPSPDRQQNRVHYIPYEEFDAFSTEETPEEPLFLKKKVRPQPQETPDPEWLDVSELETEGDTKPFFVKRKPRKEKRENTGIARLPYLINSRRRNS